MFNIFKLHNHDDREPKSWIRLEGPCVSSVIRTIILDVIEKNNYSFRELGRLLFSDLSYKSPSRVTALLSSLTKMYTPIPIPVIIKILELWEIKCKVSKGAIKRVIKIINLNTENLSLNVGGKSRIKAVKSISAQLAKILGSHAADGTLVKKPYKNFGFSYNLRISDQNKGSIEAFKKWVNEVFGITPKVKRNNKDNTWYISIYNKIIFRYLTEIFGIPHGKKTYIIFEPLPIRKAPLQIRKAFALGVLTFDGSVGIDSIIELYLRSYPLAFSVYSILQNENIDATLKFKSGFTSVRCNNLQRLDNYFERNTEPWFKLQILLQNPFKTELKPKTDEEALNVLRTLFLRKTGKTNIFEVLEKIKDLDNFSAKILTNNLSVKRRTVNTYLNFFKKVNIIYDIKNAEYAFNKNIKTWNLPSLERGVVI